MITHATSTLENVPVNGEATEAFGASLRGDLIRPGETAYDEARVVWNGMIDRRPALIARCAGPADVLLAVRFARANGLTVSVRGGGHSVAGHSVCDGGLMIDLSRMKGVYVDAARRRARAEPGVLWSELDHEAQAFGLATTGGTVSHTGIAGLTLGGGQGWLMGLHGLTCDNLISVDLVTADGQLVTASAEENADLFWAVRGGGGNFGVVTSFEYRLHEVGPTILGGMVLFPIEQAAEMLRFYRDFSISTPDALMTVAALLTTPDGMPAAALVTGWFGPIEDGERHLAPLRAFGTPLADLVGEIPYRQLQSTFDAATPHGLHRYLKMGYVPKLEDEFIARVIDHTARKPSPYSVVLFNVIKGAVTRVAPGATAFPHRDPAWHFEIFSQWAEPAEAEANIAWVRAFWDDAVSYTQGAGVNFLDSDDRDTRVRAAYGANYDRLVATKKVYDPTNFFRLNANIAPGR